MTGRRQDLIWQHYQKLTDKQGKSVRAKCKKEMSALVARMIIHTNKCDTFTISLGEEEYQYDRTNDENQEKNRRKKIRRTDISTATASSSKSNHPVVLMVSFITRTSSAEKNNIDIQIARFLYSTNSSFRHVDHPEFKKLINILRPGYNPPNRHQIGNRLLDELVYNSVKSDVQK